METEVDTKPSCAEPHLNKTAVFIDAGHIHFQLYGKWWIDYQKLTDYFRKAGYSIISVYYYEGMPTEQSYFFKHQKSLFADFLRKKDNKKRIVEQLRSYGFIVRHKPVHKLIDDISGEPRFKCNFDVEIAIDVVETVLTKDIDTFILCSGDGDFTKLVKYLKSKFKKVIVVGIKHTINAGLMISAHETIFLDDIRDEIESIK
jgi:uncharacterized LabA/DUF88 family protein